MQAVLLCEPNISEGQAADTIAEIVDQVRSEPAVRILEVSSDASHNRSVLTYLGEPEAVLRATQAMARTALELVDMSQHIGSHPRMGAVDVVPFVPIRGMSVEEAIEIARRFGRFAGGLGVPVYYYEEAATRPERKRLPAIRRGQYEALAERLGDPAWAPDEGPAVFVPKSGAVVTGVRFPLVAFNVNLHTTDLSVAGRIARAVRHIDGGYRYVRAIPVAIDGKDLVQVSMNLVNYARTPIPRVLETIRSEAARHGVSVAGSELIGPVPLGALEEVVRHYLQVHSFSTEQIVEVALLDEVGRT